MLYNRNMKNTDSERHIQKSKSNFKIGPLEMTLMALVFVGIVLVIGIIAIRSNFKNSDNFYTEFYAGRTYYIYTGEYTGEYDIQEGYIDDRSTVTTNFKTEKIMNYAEYAKYCEQWDLKQKYTDQNSNYIAISEYDIGATSVTAKLVDVKIDGSQATAFVYDSFKGVTADTAYFVIFVPVPSSVSQLKVESLVVTKKEFENIKKYNSRNNPNYVIEEKPIIYLYPESEAEMEVKLGAPDRLTTTYPKYQDGWHVLARPDGTLTDLKTGRELYSLYWEGIRNYTPDLSEGFIVKGEDSAKFLEEKLDYLGLNAKEAEEFIVYWLPKLESSPYNLIKFENTETIEDDMPIIISQGDKTITPDTLIRVRMAYKSLEEPISIKEQRLSPAPVRHGFTVVEWGGTKL